MIIKQFKRDLLKLLSIDEGSLLGSDSPSILLAVSGGIDSMAMAHLFKKVGYPNFSIATVNFNLRGEESDGDEQLVKELANSFGVTFHTTSFDTIKYSQESRISTQVAARNLRYNWFNQLLEEHNYNYVAVGHNLNDSVETLFINILRGAGLRGMAGIREKNGAIIRPLLSISRRDLAEWVVKEGIEYREDSSNAHSDYSRNRLRNMVFPEFQEINHSFLERVKGNIENVKSALGVLEEVAEEKRATIMDESGSKLSIEALIKERRGDYWLYTFLEPYGFNYDQVVQVMETLKGQPGKEFHSPSHLLIKDREWLLLYPKGGAKGVDVTVDAPEVERVLLEGLSIGDDRVVERDGYSISIKIYKRPKGFKFKGAKGGERSTPYMGDLFAPLSLMVVEPTIYLDFDRLEQPIAIRSFIEGDRFSPLGMSGFKKVTHFLTDLKIDRHSKRRVSPLLSGEQIAALPGYRVDERFKVTAESRTIMEISII